MSTWRRGFARTHDDGTESTSYKNFGDDVGAAVLDAARAKTSESGTYTFVEQYDAYGALPTDPR